MLCEYTGTQNPIVYTPDKLEKFMQHTQYQKVMLTVDTAGMGTDPFM